MWLPRVGEEGMEECVLVTIGQIGQIAVTGKVQERNACWKELSFVENTGSSSKLEEER